MAVLAEGMNRLNGRLGLPLIVNNTGGTIATAGTIPAQDKTLTAVSSNCLDKVTGNARLATIRSNMHLLGIAANRILTAVGAALLVNSVASGAPGTQSQPASNDGIITLAAAGTATGTAVDGTLGSTLADADVDAQLTIIANNIATIALALNDVTGGLPADLTDNSGGTATANPPTLAANPLPPAADGAATTSSPKAGFDTELQKIENNISDLALRTNLLARRFGLSQLTDSTGVSADTTIEALTVALTAVDGSTGTNAVDQVTGRDRLTKISSAHRSLAAKINEVCALTGLQAIVDSIGVGTVGVTLENIAATGTGVSGAGATLLDVDVDAWLVINRNHQATLAAVLNALTGTVDTQAPDVPPAVVAI
jgi:hypothetical protein